MMRKTAGALAIALAALSQQVLADTIALTWASGGSVGSSSETRGWAFSTSSAITVTALGWFDLNGGGLANSHQVGIWDSGGTLLLSGTVAAGVVDPLTGDFRYDTGLAGNPLLSAGSYVIGGLSTVNDASWRLIPAAAVTTGAEITYIENRHNGASGLFSMPTLHQVSLDVGYFGPDFQYVTAAPEPSLLALLGLGLVGLGFARRKRA